MAGSDKDVDYMDYSAMDFQESAFDSVKKKLFFSQFLPFDGTSCYTLDDPIRQEQVEDKSWHEYNDN